MRSKITTKEEKVANRLAELVSDVSVNLDDVGWHLAVGQPNIAYLRLENVIEAAKESRDERKRKSGNRLYN